MLKNLAIVALLEILLPIGVLSAQQAQGDAPKEGIAKQESAGKGQVQPQAGNDHHTAPDPVVPGTKPTTPPCDEACQQGRENLKIQNRLAWFTGGLVVAGFLQLVLIGAQAFLLWQTRTDVHAQAAQMKDQTDILKGSVAAAQTSAAAANTSAEAARENVELLINKERGRIFVELEKFDITDKSVGTQVVRFKVSYHGSTVSFLTRSMITFEVTNSEAPPNFDPSVRRLGTIYELPDLFPAYSQDFDCKVRLHRVFDQFETDQIIHGEKFIHCYGYICYRDVMERDRHTTFCHTWKPRRPGALLDFECWRKSGPPESNETT